MRPHNLPNVITCMRFLLVIPVIIAFINYHYSTAFYFFLIAGITDAVDGLLARVYGWTSYFGSIADPLADKLLLMSSFIMLGYLGYIPIALVVLVIVRDFWIVSGGVAYRIFIGPVTLKPSAISKVNTFLQIILVGYLLIHLSFGILPKILVQIIMALVYLTSLLSMVHYTWVWGLKAFRAQRMKSAKQTPLQRNMV